MKKLSSVFATCLIFVVFLVVSSVTVYAEPEDYINGFLEDFNNAVNEFINDITDEEVTEPTQMYIEPTEIYQEPTIPTEPDFYQPPTENIYTEEITEPSTPPTEYQEETPIEEATEEATEDYYYLIATEPETEYYQPEILTETHTDAPFLERFAITDATEGNVFIALALWGSIIIGVIIVLSIVISTHRRKKG